MQQKPEGSKKRAETPIEDRLGEKAEQSIKDLRGLRENKVEDIFTKRYYISPEDLLIEDYLKSRPIAAFNPGALEKDGKLLIFPRLLFDYYIRASSIGVFSLPIEEVIEGKIDKPLRVKIILWPEEPWEFGPGCEDPRVCLFDNSIYVLYTGAGQKRSVQAFVEFSSSFEPKRRGYFSIAKGNSRFVPSGNKDSAFVRIKDDEAIMLTRPMFSGLELCWRAEANLKNLTIDEQTLRPVLVSEEWEYKVGWSTNCVKLSVNKYLVGWHGVLKEDQSYKDGLAVVNADGELLGLSNYLLATKGLKEGYGDRPWVIFGDGLVKYGKYLLWIGGVSDYAIGIFITELDRALEKIRWIK